MTVDQNLVVEFNASHRDMSAEPYLDSVTELACTEQLKPCVDSMTIEP